MRYRNKMVAIVMALAFGGGGLVACGSSEDPAANKVPNQDQENQNQENQNQENQNQENQNQENQNQDNQNQENQNQENQNQENQNQENQNQENQDDPEYDAPDEAGQILLTEFMKSPTEVSVEDGQWIEFFNITDDPLDLYGCEIDSDAIDTAIEIDDEFEIDAGEFATIATGDEPGFDADHVFDDLALSGGEGYVELRCDDQWITGVWYDDGERYPSEEGVSVVRDSDLFGYDFLDEPWYWCEGTGTYNGDDVGSPGEMAEPCPWYDEDTAGDITQIREDVVEADDPADPDDPKMEYDDEVLEHVLVTYIRPRIAGDEAGFFIQASPEGPALFVEVEDAEDEEDVPVRAGQVIDLEVKAADISSTGIYITEFGDIDVIRLFVPPSMMTVEVDDVDLLDEINDYESRMVSAQMTVASAPDDAGWGFESYEVTTDGVSEADNNADEPSLQFRVPIYHVTNLGLEVGCQVAIEDVPMWRYKNNPQLSIWKLYEADIVDCSQTQPVEALAMDETTVSIDFNRALGGVEEDGSEFQIDGLDVVSAHYEYARVVLETEAQDRGEEYTITFDPLFDDFWGEEVDGSVSFDGYESREVVISEFLAQFQGGPASQDPGMFVELHNLGGEAFELDECVLSRPGLSSPDTEFPQGEVIPAGGEVLITSHEGGGAELKEVTTFGWSGGALPLGGTTVELVCDGEVKDFITYTDEHTAQGISYQKDVDYLGAANPEGGLLEAAWCFTPQIEEFRYWTGDDDDPDAEKFGTPGEENTSCD